MASVTIKDVVKRYGSVQVMHGVSVDIEDGEFVVLVGRTFPCLIPCPRRLAHSLFFRNKRSSGLLFGAI